MPNAQMIHQARENGSVSRSLFGLQRINVDDVVDLVTGGSQPMRHAAIRINANRLLELMADDEWEIRASSHQGGIGGQGRSSDFTRHITLRVGSSGYHLRQDSRGHLFEITGPGMLAIKPWASPGMDAMKA